MPPESTTVMRKKNTFCLHLLKVTDKRTRIWIRNQLWIRNQVYGSKDPEPVQYQNVTDPENCFIGFFVI